MATSATAATSASTAVTPAARMRSMEITHLVVALERRAFLEGYHKAFAMGAGPCELCKTCLPGERECRHPEKARPAMEACGIDVFQTARNNGFPIDTVKNPDCRQNYYGLLLLE